MGLEQVKKLPIVKANRQKHYQNLFDIFSKHQDQVRIIHKSERVPPPPLAYSKNISIENRKKIKEAVLEAHKHGEIGGYGGKMSHYISVKDSDYDVLRNVVKLLEKNKK